MLFSCSIKKIVYTLITTKMNDMSRKGLFLNNFNHDNEYFFKPNTDRQTRYSKSFTNIFI